MRKLKAMISEAKTISVLTGAGISTESGIPDFRSTKGLWREDVSRMDVISRDYFEREPELFWKYFKDIFQIKLSHSYEPNSGHLLLKELERSGKDVRIFTQNVDGLHHKAGSGKVYELHGSILFAACPECGKEHHLDYINEQIVPLCSDEACQQILKPDVVLFGDMVRCFEEMYESISESDLFLVIGTSLEVFPVRQVPLDFRHKATLGMVLINAEPTRLDPVFDLVIHGKSGAIAKALAE
ncbi:NAD-dependent protein deacylase [Metabacillus sp. GX 13764]|uniref:NAD-dependent protein deacylase n=1 Tax=Metabacillus kandeliae TaxID=2900151 RepID=UPI001E48443F|nr:NAD-dependent protein deacylase [Metabacillus kandeliae]